MYRKPPRNPPSLPERSKTDPNLMSKRSPSLTFPTDPQRLGMRQAWVGACKTGQFSSSKSQCPAPPGLAGPIGKSVIRTWLFGPWHQRIDAPSVNSHFYLLALWCRYLKIEACGINQLQIRWSLTTSLPGVLMEQRELSNQMPSFVVLNPESGTWNDPHFG